MTTDVGNKEQYELKAPLWYYARPRRSRHTGAAFERPAPEHALTVLDDAEVHVDEFLGLL